LSIFVDVLMVVGGRSSTRVKRKGKNPGTITDADSRWRDGPVQA
jgi:hypothetical protein